jgi:hypothetical protein
MEATVGVKRSRAAAQDSEAQVNRTRLTPPAEDDLLRVDIDAAVDLIRKEVSAELALGRVESASAILGHLIALGSSHPFTTGSLGPVQRKISQRLGDVIGEAYQACSGLTGATRRSVTGATADALSRALLLCLPVCGDLTDAYLAVTKHAASEVDPDSNAVVLVMARGKSTPQLAAIMPLLNEVEGSDGVQAGTTSPTITARAAVRAAALCARSVLVTSLAWGCLLRDHVHLADVAEASRADFEAQERRLAALVGPCSAKWDAEDAKRQEADAALEQAATDEAWRRTGRRQPARRGDAEAAEAAPAAEQPTGGAAAAGEGDRDSEGGELVGDASDRSHADESNAAEDEPNGDEEAEEDKEVSGHLVLTTMDLATIYADLLQSGRPEIEALLAARKAATAARDEAGRRGLQHKAEAAAARALSSLYDVLVDAVEASALDALSVLQRRAAAGCVGLDAAVMTATQRLLEAHEHETTRAALAQAHLAEVQGRLREQGHYFASSAPNMRLTLEQAAEEAQALAAEADAAAQGLRDQLRVLGSVLALLPIEVRQCVCSRLQQLIAASAAAEAGGVEAAAAAEIGSGEAGDSSEGASPAATASAALQRAFSAGLLAEKLQSAFRHAVASARLMRDFSGGSGRGAVPAVLRPVQELLEGLLPAERESGGGTAAGAGPAPASLSGRAAGFDSGAANAPGSSVRLPLPAALIEALTSVTRSVAVGCAAVSCLGGIGGVEHDNDSEEDEEDKDACAVGSAGARHPLALRRSALVCIRALAAGRHLLAVVAPGFALLDHDSGIGTGEAAGAGAGAGARTDASGSGSLMPTAPLWGAVFSALPTAQQVLVAAAPAKPAAAIVAAHFEPRLPFTHLPASADFTEVLTSGAAATVMHSPAGAAAGSTEGKAAAVTVAPASTSSCAPVAAAAAVPVKPRRLAYTCRSLFDAHGLLGPYPPADFSRYLADGPAAGAAARSAASPALKGTLRGGAEASPSSSARGTATQAPSAKRPRHEESSGEADIEEMHASSRAGAGASGHHAGSAHSMVGRADAWTAADAMMDHAEESDDGNDDGSEVEVLDDDGEPDVAVAAEGEGKGSWCVIM